MKVADRISLAPTASDVSRFNIWFDDKCARGGIGPRLAADLKLCINEVLANTISYGFKDTRNGWIVVRINLTRKRASANIIDNGAYFDLTGWVVPKNRDLATAEPGGFGIALIKERASEITYRRFCGRNHLRVTCEASDP